MLWVLLAAIAIIVLLILSGRTSADPAQMRKSIRVISAFLAGALAIWFATKNLYPLTVLLSVAAVALFAAPLFPVLAGGRGEAGYASQVESDYLRVTVERDTGDISGIVLAGRFAGRDLSDMTRTELTDLHEELKVADTEGARLMDAYMARIYDGEWVSEHAARNDEYGAGSEMTVDDAFEVLGLQRNASEQDIKSAHRQLMKKFHPDQGGSTYFAARLNQAKDLLLKG